MSEERTATVFAVHSSWSSEAIAGVASYDTICGIAIVVARRRRMYGSQIHPNGFARIPDGTGSLLPQTQAKELPGEWPFGFESARHAGQRMRALNSNPRRWP